MEPADHIPLTEPTTFILLSLLAGPQHGYAILKDVQTLSDNRIVLSTGTLYGALKRLLDLGWIIRKDAQDTDIQTNGRGQKVYALTEKGRQIFSAEITRMEKLVGVSRLRNAGELP
jgi:DNA-binding PadR family transcriptional regulator